MLNKVNSPQVNRSAGRKLFLIFFTILLIGNYVNAQTKPYLILISVDGFRWDYANRGITPNIDHFKENGVSALSLRPDFPSKTFPNHYAIITGMYPENNGLIENTFYDPYTKETYKISDSTQVKNGKWYLGEAFWETAKRNGIKTASYFWPGSEINPEYRRPDYFEHYQHSRPFEERVNGVINWMKLPYSERPHFITLYFEATDDAGHRFGPDSKEVNEAIKKEDTMIGLLLKKLSDINLKDSTDIIIVSDHGMTPVSNKRMVNVENILEGYSQKDVRRTPYGGAPKIFYQSNGPLMMIQPEKTKVEEVYNFLKMNRDHFEVFTKENIPACYHFSNNAFIPDIILIADLGWSLVDNRSIKWMEKITEGGNHGYDNFALDMNGIFFAIGPDFKKGYRTGTINNIDIYPLMCKIFNITPRSNIDGRMEDIEYVLKGY